MAKGDKLRQSQLMMQAAQAGHQAESQARQGMIQQRERGADRIAQQGMQLGQMAEQGESRKQQRDIATGQQVLTARGQNIQAASAGVEQTGNESLGPLLDERAQNLQKQMDEGLEMGSGVGRPMVPGGEWGKTEDQQALEVSQANTARINALTQRQHASNKAKQLDLKGDKEGAAAERAKLIKPLEIETNSFNNLMNGSASDSDWSTIAKSVGQNEFTPEVSEAIKNREMTPRLISALKTKMAADAVQYVFDSDGDLPAGDKVDYTHPKMQEFLQTMGGVNATMKHFGPFFSFFAGIDSVEKKNKFVAKMAAWMTMEGLGQMPAGGGEMDPLGGLTPGMGEGRTGEGPMGEAPVPEARGGLMQRGTTPTERMAAEKTQPGSPGEPPALYGDAREGERSKKFKGIFDR